MNDLDEKFWREKDYLEEIGSQYGQQYILQKGIKKFKEKGEEAILKEIKQLHDRKCFQPIKVQDITEAERRKAQVALTYLTEKRDGTIKARTVYNGKPTREWLSREESASPTASLEGIFITSIIDAMEDRDVMTADVPNAFIQTPMPIIDEKDKVIMKLTGVLVDILLKMAPDIYKDYVTLENGKRVIYLNVLRAIYGMLVSALLWYKKFKKDLESIGFIFNPYDACVANREVNNKQHTVRFHVDDLMSSHEDAKVNDEFLEWLNKMYGEHGEVKAVRGNKHDYLGMTLEFKNKEVKIDMTEYVKGMLSEFPIKFNKNENTRTPAGVEMFAEDNSKRLNQQQREIFHRITAKALFLCKRGRPDIQPIVAVLCTRVKNPGTKDWNKLVRMMKFLRNTEDDVLTLSAEHGVSRIIWSIDSAFGVHPDYKSHVGGCMKFHKGKGTPINLSAKHKLNTESSTTSELVGVDYVLPMVLWVPLFLEKQGYNVEENLVLQDNKSTILLAKNGKASSGKRTRALNIRYFYVTDQIERGNITMDYCHTDDMTADYLSKSLQGMKFEKFRGEIMGFD